MFTKATNQVSFEYKIRNCLVYVQAEGWSDDEGIYQSAITSVDIDGADVFGLLTPEDIGDLEIAADAALSDAAFEHKACEIDYKRDAFQLGE